MNILHIHPLLQDNDLFLVFVDCSRVNGRACQQGEKASFLCTISNNTSKKPAKKRWRPNWIVNPTLPTSTLHFSTVAVVSWQLPAAVITGSALFVSKTDANYKRCFIHPSMLSLGPKRLPVSISPCHRLCELWQAVHHICFDYSCVQRSERCHLHFSFSLFLQWVSCLLLWFIIGLPTCTSTFYDNSATFFNDLMTPNFSNLRTGWCWQLIQRIRQVSQDFVLFKYRFSTFYVFSRRIVDMIHSREVFRLYQWTCPTRS